MKKFFILSSALLLVAGTAFSSDRGRANIEPLVSTAWKQGAPYNNMCPKIGSTRCQTGCVATAMAQIMNFHKWPTTSEAIPAYKSYSVSVDALPSVSFAWDKMRDTYGATASSEERDAVAQLMLYCGASVQMDYGVSTSAAWEGDAARALVKYFGYDTSVREVFRNMYGTTAWENLIYKELAAGHPVFYGGMPSGYLHQFVCDGYKDGLFHMNMGWSLSPNDYYSLDKLDRYPEGQSAIIGIHHGENAPFGTVFEKDGLRFTVIGAEEVSVSGLAQGVEPSALEVPAMVENDGVQWRVSTVDYSAFEDCSTLSVLRLPATVDVIGYRMVLGCKQLASIEVDDANPWYMAEEGVLMSKDSKELVAYPINKADAAYSVPDGVTALPASFFRGNTHLTQVTLPASLQTIDILTFRDCTGLTRVVSKNVSPVDIEDMAFDSDTYEKATLVVPKGTVATYKKRDGWSLFANIVEEDETSGVDGVKNTDAPVKSRFFTLSGSEVKGGDSGIVIDAFKHRKSIVK